MRFFLKDLQVAWRMMRRAPVLTTVAVASLAVGLAANVTIFSLLNAVFFKSFPYQDGHELVTVFGTEAKQGPQGAFLPISRPNFEDFRDRSQSMAEMANLLFAGGSLRIGEGEPQPAQVQLVSGNFFDLLRLKPALGRFFLPEEDEVPGRNPVAVLPYRIWRERFGADPAVIGKTVILNAHSYTIVGVTPESFEGAVFLGAPTLWVPTMCYQLLLPPVMQGHFENRRALLTFVIGRMKPGVSTGQAEADLRTIAKALESEYPEPNAGRSAGLMSLAEARLPPQIRDLFVKGGGLLMVVVGLVLLIACANVANLLLARAMERQPEIAVRLSLGASRSRLVRQLLAESLLLASFAAGTGLLLAWWGRSVLWAFRPQGLQGAFVDLSFDGRVLAFTVLVALATSLLFGLAPALQATRPQLLASIKEGGSKARGGGRLFGGRNLLVSGQVALSLVALICSGLFLRSLANATKIDPGFDAEQVVAALLDTSAVGYDAARSQQFFEDLEARLGALPTVEAAALGGFVPLAGAGFMRTVIVEDRDPKAENNSILTMTDPVGDQYFRALGIDLVAGRPFTSADRPGNGYAAIFNQAAAKRFFPDGNALGQRFKFFGETWLLEIVGIAADSKIQTLGEEPTPVVYLPFRQHPAPFMAVFARAKGAPEPLVGQLRAEIRALERNLPVIDDGVMTKAIRQSLWPARMAASLLGLFGGLALLLALAGIYGVMSYAVQQRHREIGIRMALGAQQESLVGMILKRGMLVVAVGMAVGLGLALLATRGLKALLYGLSPTDLTTFAGTAAALTIVAFAATLLPARRAAAVDPVKVLKG